MNDLSVRIGADVAPAVAGLQEVSDTQEQIFILQTKISKDNTLHKNLWSLLNTLLKHTQMKTIMYSTIQWVLALVHLQQRNWIENLLELKKNLNTMKLPVSDAGFSITANVHGFVSVWHN